MLSISGCPFVGPFVCGHDKSITKWHIKQKFLKHAQDAKTEANKFVCEQHGSIGSNF